jgi:hypothetical protein
VVLPWLLAVAALSANEPYSDAYALIQFDFDSRKLNAAGDRTRISIHPEFEGPRRAGVRDAIQAAMRRYPPEMITRHVRGVYVVARMFEDGVEIGGSYITSPPGISFTLGPPEDGVDEPWIRDSFHHEFAHAIYVQRPGFPRKAWDAQNAPGFKYGRNGYSAIKEGRYGRDIKTSLATKGLISEYAASDASEDFAEVAGRMMANDADFWRACRKYPRIRAKANLVMAFYRKVDPNFRLEDAPKDLFAPGGE